ncbi:MAG: AraC family transcriptional regulator [Chitinophagaceae bacterium]
MSANINIMEIPNMDLAYVLSIGPQNVENAYGKLIQWATTQGLMNDQTKMVTIYHDSFKVTEANRVMMSAAILLNKTIEARGEIGLTSIKAGKYIVGSFEIALSEFEKSWTGLFLWMNDNGYEKADRDVFEIYHNNFNEHSKKRQLWTFIYRLHKITRLNEG